MDALRDRPRKNPAGAGPPCKGKRAGKCAKKKTRPRPGGAPKRKPGRGRVFRFTAEAAGLHRLHFVGLQALLALHDLERDLLAFLQRLEAGALDGTEVHEQVRAGLRGDEAEALGVVEPLDGTGLTIGHLSYSLMELLRFWIHGRDFRSATAQQGVNDAM